MHASEVMTTEIVSTTADTPVREIARTLLEHGISAMPVLDADGVPIGMVSEGDLVTHDDRARKDGARKDGAQKDGARNDQIRTQRQDWWLKLLADEATPDDDLLATLRAPDRTARDVMSAPIVTVSEDTELAEIARLLTEHRIKRVPVVNQDRMVGIVSRADLLRALATPQAHTAAPQSAPPKRGFLAGMFSEYHRPAWQVVPPKDDASSDSPSENLDAAAFRALVDDSKSGAAQQQDAIRKAAAQQRQELAKQLMDTHVSDELWQDLQRRARQVAEAGGPEFLLLRFPNELCTDGGRAIDVAQDGWPATLRGEPAELYLRWERELKDRGFRLAARVLEYPDGMPGDIGLFLVWGEAA